MNLKSEILLFSSKLIEHERDISTTITSFEERIESLSVNNRFVGKIEAAKLKIETNIER